MSDPASRPEGDTVLASIRRILVNTQDDDAGPGEESAIEPLILTADLRVDAGEDASPDETGGDIHDASATNDPQQGAQPAARTTVAAENTPTDLPQGQEASALENTVVDEEFLRDIVSEIVREELQGELGERITRNVRKLVRREIHRAMASRDFD